MWNERREKHLRTWVLQMTRSAMLMDKAAAWLARVNFIFLLSVQFCTAYTSIIPVATLGCPHLTPGRCVSLGFSAIALAVVGSVAALVGGMMDFGAKSKSLHDCGEAVTKLARQIDLQLQRDRSSREDVNQFTDRISHEYDEIMRTVPTVPRFIFRSDDLLNLTLLSSYITDHPAQPPRESMERDDVLAEKLTYEMRRFLEMQQ